ncbi:MAG: molybdopterin cofactor-binding domain-containing protein [Verrucomicrobiales bacterium]
MSDQEDNITPFELPGDTEDESETFAERLRRRRDELSSAEEPARASWQSRARTLVALVAESPHPAASIARKNGDAARALDGIEAVIFAENLPPFQNALGHDFSGEPLLAEEEVFYRGQPVAIVVGTDEQVCRRALEILDVEYHESPGILTLDHALAMRSHHGDERVCERGKTKEALADAARTLEGSLAISPQQACLGGISDLKVQPVERGAGLRVTAKSLLPTAVRSAVAKAAAIPETEVRLEPTSLAGVTAALEMEPVRLAMLATHAAVKCGTAVTLRPVSAHSSLLRGRRHETRADFEVGFDETGLVSAIDLRLALDGGYFPADASVVMDRAMLHADSVYGIPNLRIRTRLCRTNRLNASCLPAEGSAQGAWAMEEIIQRVAEATGLTPRKVRERNFYREGDELKTTPYGQTVSATAINRVWHQVLRRSDFEIRVEDVAEWNRNSSSYKRGIAITPIKFGVGDPRAERNAAAVIVQVLADGSVLVRVGLVDVNDGLDKQIREEVAHCLGVEESAIRVVLNDFDGLSRATPVIGVDSAGLVLRATEQACTNLLKRLRDVALQLFAARGQTEIELESIRFVRGFVGTEISPQSPLHFKEVIEGAWRKRVNLAETGYHRAPNLWWDPDLGAGWPFSAFTYAAVVTEVQVDAFTGEIQILRVDIAHEGSPSPNQNDRDYAQLMRAFTLGCGWILSEEVPPPDAEDPDAFPVEEGVFGFADAPFEVVADRLRPLGDALATPGDPCSEAPVLLAVSVREALRDALRAFGLEDSLDVEVPLPATPPRVIATFKEISRQIRERGEKESS